MPIKIFIWYAHEDELFLNRLKAQLRPLLQQGIIEVWHDRDISGGTEWRSEIQKYLNSAQIILLLVSPDFMNSDYCYGMEMTLALERHKAGDANVIPILLRPVDLEEAPFGKIEVLPSGRKFISASRNRDEAFLNVETGIKIAIQEIQAQIAKAEYLKKAKAHFEAGEYGQAVMYYEHIIRLDPNDAFAYFFKGNVLSKIERYDEAMQAYEEAIRLDPSNIIMHHDINDGILTELQEYRYAISSCLKFASLFPKAINSYPRIVKILEIDRLKRTK